MIRVVLLGCALFAAAHCLEDAAVSTDVASVADETPSLMSLVRRKRDLYDNMYGNGMMMGRPMMGGMYPGGMMYQRRMMGGMYPGMMYPYMYGGFGGMDGNDNFGNFGNGFDMPDFG